MSLLCKQHIAKPFTRADSALSRQQLSVQAHRQSLESKSQHRIRHEAALKLWRLLVASYYALHTAITVPAYILAHCICNQVKVVSSNTHYMLSASLFGQVASSSHDAGCGSV